MEIIIFNKIKFKNFRENHLKKLFNHKGLFVFPAAPALSKIYDEKKYHEALIKADHVFFDSGYFVLLLKLLKRINVNKLSGYKFLNFFFNFLKKNKNKIIFNIDSDLDTSFLNHLIFKKKGVKKIYSYIAPKYDVNNIKDLKLINKLNKVKPDYILTNIGGGVQEILGLYVKNKVNFKPTIFCTGAAISFFTNKQAPINNFIDKFYLGWFFRILFNPKIFLPRYASAFKLFFIILKTKIQLYKNK